MVKSRKELYGVVQSRTELYGVLQCRTELYGVVQCRTDERSGNESYKVVRIGT